MGLQPRCSSSVCSCVTVGGPPGLLSGFKLSVICDEQLTNGKKIYSAFRCFFSFFLVDGFILCYIYYYILWNYFKLMDQWYILFINAKWVLIYKYLKNRFVSLPEGEPLQSCLFCFLFLCFFQFFFGWGGVWKVLLFLVFDTSTMVKLCGCQNTKWFRNEHQLQKRILSLLLIGYFCLSVINSLNIH